MDDEAKAEAKQLAAEEQAIEIFKVKCVVRALHASPPVFFERAPGADRSPTLAVSSSRPLLHAPHPPTLLLQEAD